MKNIQLSQSLKPLSSKFAHIFKPYMGIIFFLLLASIYGFVIFRINTLSSATADSSEVSSKVKAAPTPRIDAHAIKQLQSLKDNSVNVQTLFEQKRTNPFEE